MGNGNREEKLWNTLSQTGCKREYETGIKRATKKDKESLSKNESIENVGTSSLVFGSSRHNVVGILHRETNWSRGHKRCIPRAALRSMDFATSGFECVMVSTKELESCFALISRKYIIYTASAVSTRAKAND